MKIYIVGCAKTRTTLVQWLFSGFENTVVIPGECDISVFRGHGLQGSNANVVAKRCRKSILSDKISMRRLFKQALHLYYFRIALVRTVRNDSAVLGSTSDNNTVTSERLEACKKQYARFFRHHVKCTINTDELLSNPDKVQYEVVKSLGLEVKQRWSEWPVWAPMGQMFYIPYGTIYRRLGSKT